MPRDATAPDIAASASPPPARDWPEAIWATVQDEFSDLPDPEQITRIVLRLLLAALLGGVLGYEREQQGKAAGVRTHMLVALGAAMFVLVPLNAGMAMADLSRVLQGVVAGVGFLGAGTILKRQQARDVKGLTTAAGIWMTAAIGVACGMGREATAVLSMLLALGVLSVVPHLLRDRPGDDPEEEAERDMQGDTEGDGRPGRGD